MLAAAGMIYERFRGKKRIQMHRYNVLSGAIQDCDLDEDTSRTVACGLSVDEDLRLYGGSIVYEDVQANATPRWDLTGDLENDIDAMWEICRKNTRLWNRQTGLLKSAEKHSLPQTDPLVCAVPLSVINGDPEFEGGASVFRRPFFRSLKRAGLLETAEREGTLLLIYKNGQIRRCLTKEGQALEMKIYLTALRAREKDGSPSYGDVKNGVVIDWDGLTHDEEGVYDTENEIDVLMMHGMVPVFVSCKNGFVETEELYKLNTVAERFGGRYARRVLVAADPGGAAHAAALRERAKDMRIRMVEGIQEMSDAELLRTVRSFWSMS